MRNQNDYSKETAVFNNYVLYANDEAETWWNAGGQDLVCDLALKALDVHEDADGQYDAYLVSDAEAQKFLALASTIPGWEEEPILVYEDGDAEWQEMKDWDTEYDERNRRHY